MSTPSSLTLNYDAVLSTTLFNYHPTLEDNITTSNAFLFMLMRRQEGGYVSVDALGERMAVSLRYANTPFDSYSGYDTLDTTPTDGITQAFFTWRQAATPIAISGLEEKQNTGRAAIFNLLSEKLQQGTDGIREGFSKALLQGEAVNDNTARNIETAYVSPVNGSSFIDPIPLLIKIDPTTSTTVGNINQSTYSWWRNQATDSGASNYAGFLTELRSMNNDCSKGPGGPPNLHLADQNTYELYEAALAAQHRNPSYQVADIPFDNIAFKNKPVVWDEFVPNFNAGTTTEDTAQGSWVMMNTKFFMIKYHSGTNFAPTPFVKPENQDARVSHILWLGALGVSNRRKNGVLYSIDTTITS